MLTDKQRSHTAKAAALVLALTLGSGTAAYAGTWQNGVFGDGVWSYADTNEVQRTGWKWLDGNKDGAYECYYFDSEGKMLADTTIGQYVVNSDGAWTVNGAVQRRGLPSWLQYTKVYEETSEQNAKERIAYPDFSLKNFTPGTAVNRQITDYVKAVRANAKADGDVQGYSSENDLDYDILLSKSGKYAGLSFQNYTYQDGAAHGLTEERYFTLTADKGILKMSDIGGSSLENTVTAYVRSELKKRSDSGSLVLFTNPDSLNIDFSRQNWMLADDGLHVLFQQYEIAPYAAGLIDVAVPYSALKGQMNAYGQGLIG